MSAEFEEWERRTYERARPALRICKALAALLVACWAVSFVWVYVTMRQRVECIYNAESVEAWDECSKVTRLEIVVRALNGPLLDP